MSTRWDIMRERTCRDRGEYRIRVEPFVIAYPDAGTIL